jgi:thioredoxin 2
MAAYDFDDRGIVTACASCGQRNRLLYDHLGTPQRCGQCKADLPPLSSPLEIQRSADFDRLLEKADVPVVVDFWAPWCGPCRMVAPELAKVAARANRRFVIVKVNTDALADLGQRFGVRSIPTLAVFSSGGEVSRMTGARPALEIEAFIQKATTPVHR